MYVTLHFNYSQMRNAIENVSRSFINFSDRGTFRICAHTVSGRGVEVAHPFKSPILLLSSTALGTLNE